MARQDQRINGINILRKLLASHGETKFVTGDHIDLWNGSRLTATGWNFLSTLGRRIGINEVLPGTDLGYSDVRNATEILFWEVK